MKSAAPAAALALLALVSWWIASRERELAGEGEVPPLPATRAEILASGHRIVTARRCEYCHETERSRRSGHPRADCQDCHRSQGLTAHLAPPLARIAAIRPGDWLRRYLRAPFPVRTNQPNRMPDLALPDHEIEVLARYLEELAADSIRAIEPDGVRREDDPDPVRLGRGRRLWEALDCGACHALGEGRPRESISAQARFAPDLTTAWLRARPGWMSRAIRRPSRWLPRTAMPETTAMTEEEALDLAWYVTNAVASPPPAASWVDAERVFQTRCLSCHYGPLADPPASANPEGGAGWLATWSRAPRRLSLTDYESTMRGATDDLGRPRAVVVPYDTNSLLLLHVKGAKHPAMPFGRDPLPPSEIRVLEDWIASGAKGPRREGGVLVHPPIEVGGE